MKEYSINEALRELRAPNKQKSLKESSTSGRKPLKESIPQYVYDYDPDWEAWAVDDIEGTIETLLLNVPAEERIFRVNHVDKAISCEDGVTCLLKNGECYTIVDRGDAGCAIIADKWPSPKDLRLID